jgi:hypothetical protein
MARVQLLRKSARRPEDIVQQYDRDTPLTSREVLFLDEYLRDFHGSRAAIAAGYPRRRAHSWAYEITRRPAFQRAFNREMAARRERIRLQIDDVVTYHLDAASADPRKLSPTIVGCCRYCWGEDHEYQYTQTELRKELRAYRFKNAGKRDPLPMDTKGGDGFDKLKPPMRGPYWIRLNEEPNSDHSCPECHGVGELVFLPPDLSKLSRGELLIYGGVRVYKDGTFEVKINPRIQHMDRVAELVGLIRPRRVKRDVNLEELDESELDSLLTEAQNRGLLNPQDVSDAQNLPALPSIGPRDQDFQSLESMEDAQDSIEGEYAEVGD